VRPGTASDAEEVARQAGLVAAAWSPPGAPSSWRLTAAQFETLRDDAKLMAIATTIPLDRLPPLLFTAAATFLVLKWDPSRWGRPGSRERRSSSWRASRRYGAARHAARHSGASHGSVT
jgi:hypothetical protein